MSSSASGGSRRKKGPNQGFCDRDHLYPHPHGSLHPASLLRQNQTPSSRFHLLLLLSSRALLRHLNSSSMSAPRVVRLAFELTANRLVGSALVTPSCPMFSFTSPPLLLCGIFMEGINVEEKSKSKENRKKSYVWRCTRQLSTQGWTQRPKQLEEKNETFFYHLL